MIEQVRIVPADGDLTIELKGEFAGILVVAEGARRCSGCADERALQIKMVAGVGFDRELKSPC